MLWFDIIRHLCHYRVELSLNLLSSLFLQTSSKTNDFQTHADRRMRHYRLLRQQVHELELNQRSLKRNLFEMQNHKLSDRVRNLEIEQKRLASSNFNLSRQVSDFDKLHTSMLELLEDVEEIETKLDKTMPEIRREISKVEIDSAQLTSDQNILKEEDHNMAKTIQALAVSISTLQNQRSLHRNVDREVNNLKMEVEILKEAAALNSRNKVSSVLLRTLRTLVVTLKFIARQKLAMVLLKFLEWMDPAYMTGAYSKYSIFHPKHVSSSWLKLLKMFMHH